VTYTVIFSAPAEADLFAIYDYIAERAGGAIALRFVESIEAYCLGFAHMPERGTKRDCRLPQWRAVRHIRPQPPGLSVG
jgi:plasmid stabilization system protein ParE